MQRTLLTLALIATAGVAQAQTMLPASPTGGPVIGRDDWVRQKGDQPGPATGRSGSGGHAMSTDMMSPSMSQSTATATAPTMATGERRDPYGRPFIGRNDWVRQRGDQPGPSSGGGSAGAGAATTTGGASTMPMTTTGGSRQAVMKDEFGNRYDARGNRIDARGNIISPPVSK